MIDKGCISYFDLVRQATVDAEGTDRSGIKTIGPVGLAMAAIKAAQRVFFIGNGGSLSACSHMANDLCLAGVQAMALDSAVNMACLGNDMGFDDVFDRQIKWFMAAGDVLVALSCSGKSPNILNACARGHDLGGTVITFSGFKRDNPLRKAGDLNFWVPSESYGVVQLAHEALLHCIIDNIAGLI